MIAQTISENKEGSTRYCVVAASDFSPLGDRAVVEALRLCGPRPEAVLHVITVGAEGPTGVLLPGLGPRFLTNTRAEKLARVRIARTVNDYVAEGHPFALERVAVYVTVGSPAERILALAGAVDADLIVLGTHGRQGLGRLLLGSVAEEVVKRAPCGVLVIRPRDFLDGERLPEIQPPLKPGEHPLLPFRTQPTYHYVHRLSRETHPLIPSF